ncbi:glycosyltransferase 87 family protein [Conyzicola sp.]|uniref:glycosyltransferase 87 family protein n=1 Tax=Conyzicola sp. TaxID=1969404 RepID=UPI0039894097
MTDAAGSPRRIPTVLRSVATSRAALWAGFVVAHLWLGMLNLYGPGFPLGDVTITYRLWIDQIVTGNFWMGIDSVWVYPILAIVPMLAAFALGPALYASTWLSMVMLLDAVAFAAITGWGRSRDRAAVGWWWIAFLVLLGPIAVARIDSVSVPLAIVGVLLLATRPTAAAVVLTVATWVKVWPAALLAAILIACRGRSRLVLTAASVSAAIVLVALLFGSGSNVFSFVTQQTGRGMQAEAPVSTVWAWQALFGVPNTYIYYDQDILSFQIVGDGVATAAAVMTPILAVVALAVAATGVWAARRGATPTELLAPLALALVTTLIVVNKVGSPQFIAWLAVPIVLGLAANAAGHAPSFRFPAAIVLVVAVMTQALYPYFYVELISLNPIMLTVLTVRNALLCVLLAWAVRSVVLVGRHAVSDGLTTPKAPAARRSDLP